MQMEFKNKDYSKLQDLNGSLTAPLKTADKKARKKLWDSMLEVYEKEAADDSKDVDVSELEQWCEKMQETSIPRAFLVLMETKPHVVSQAFPGWFGEPVEDSDKTKRDHRKKRKKPGKQISAAVVKTKGIIKPPVGMKPNLATDPSGRSSNKMKRKQERKDSTKPKKSVKYSKDNTIQTYSKTLQNAQKHIENISSIHICNLELRYPSEMEDEVVRPDRRVFRCKLIFRVCECFESDEKF